MHWRKGPTQIDATASKVGILIVHRSGSDQMDARGTVWKEQQLYVASDDPRVSLFLQCKK